MAESISSLYQCYWRMAGTSGGVGGRGQLLAHFKGSHARRFVIIDEFQRVPALLDEVHHLIEDYGFIFSLCGSSARKLKRGYANLLGGRALRYQLGGLTSFELGHDFNLERMLNHGFLPRVHTFNGQSAGPSRARNFAFLMLGS